MYNPYGGIKVLNSFSARTADREPAIPGLTVEIEKNSANSSPYDDRKRYYLPASGRWLTQDPTGAMYVDGADLYQFGLSNPMAYVDPAGLAAAGAAAGAGAAAADAALDSAAAWLARAAAAAAEAGPEAWGLAGGLALAAGGTWAANHGATAPNGWVIPPSEMGVAYAEQYNQAQQAIKNAQNQQNQSNNSSSSGNQGQQQNPQNQNQNQDNQNKKQNNQPPDDCPEKVRRQMEKAGLPQNGSKPFKPAFDKNKAGEPILRKGTITRGPKSGKVGYVDQEGNIWIKDRAHAGDPDHWDVQQNGGASYYRVGLNGEPL